MEEQMKDRLTSRDVWVRALYMIFFLIAYGVAEIVLTLVVVFQFLTTLITGSVNEPLLRFGHNLSQYVYQILQFQTFNTEEKAFPFTDWPDEEPGENRWLADDSADVDRDEDPQVDVEIQAEVAADVEADVDETDLPPRS